MMGSKQWHRRLKVGPMVHGILQVEWFTRRGSSSKAYSMLHSTEVVNGVQLHRLWKAQMLSESSPHAKTTRSHSHRVRD